MNMKTDTNPLTAVPAAQLGETVLSLRDLLRREHRKGQLLSWLQRAATEAFLLDQARALGLHVEDAELQQTADLFRRQQQVLSADQTRAWLTERSLSADDFEAFLEDNLLLDKLKRHVIGDGVAERFRSRPADFDQLRLQQMLLAREDLAREVHVQLTEEGADFGELAARHSLHPSRAAGGQVGPILRRQLTGPVRQAVDSARVGVPVGPVATPEGFYLLVVEEVTAAQLDAATAAAIAQDLFGEWLAQRLAEAAFSAPLLDVLA